MSKIIQAVNAMVANSDKVTNVEQGEGGKEFFFLYKEKYKWSIVKNENKDEYFLHYYPDEMSSIELLASIPQGSWEGIQYVTYSTAELKTRESIESFAELYIMVKENLYNINQALDDIIGDDLF